MNMCPLTLTIPPLLAAEWPSVELFFSVTVLGPSSVSISSSSSSDEEEPEAFLLLFGSPSLSSSMLKSYSIEKSSSSSSSLFTFWMKPPSMRALTFGLYSAHSDSSFFFKAGSGCDDGCCSCCAGCGWGF